MTQHVPVPEPELCVVVPAYNEAPRLAALVEEWGAVLRRLQVDYRIAIYDDGSTDDTPRVLAKLAQQEPHLAYFRHPNRGHGPTLARGYREARGRWLLQIDGDGELGASEFAALWSQRSSHDLLLGRRPRARGGPLRRGVSGAARLCVRTLFGGRVEDVNVPYRLMRRSAFAPLVGRLPEGAFAPNVLLTALAVRRGLRIHQAPVALRGARPGLRGLPLWRGALRALFDLLGLVLGRRGA